VEGCAGDGDLEGRRHGGFGGVASTWSGCCCWVAV
jgi:hypothetical protein